MKKLILILCLFLGACSSKQVEKIGEIGVPAELSTHQKNKMDKHIKIFEEYSIRYCLYGENFLKFDSNIIQRCDYREVNYYITDPFIYYRAEKLGKLVYSDQSDRFLIFREDEIVYVPVEVGYPVGRHLTDYEKVLYNKVWNQGDNIAMFLQLIVTDTTCDHLDEDGSAWPDDVWLEDALKQVRSERQYSFYKHKIEFNESKYLE